MLQQIDDSLELQDKERWDKDRKDSLYTAALNSWRSPDTYVSGPGSFHSRLTEVLHHDQFVEVAANNVRIDELLRDWVRELVDNPIFGHVDIPTANEIKDNIRKLSDYLDDCKESTTEERKRKETLAWTLDILDGDVKKRKQKKDEEDEEDE